MGFTSSYINLPKEKNSDEKREKNQILGSPKYS